MFDKHKGPLMVFYILHLMTSIVFIRQLMNGCYESAFYCALSCLLLHMPGWIQVKLNIELPSVLEIIILCFIYAAEILGEVNAFYINVPHWDTMLHTLNGFLAAAVGFAMVSLLNDAERLTFNLSPIFLALVAFSFSMTIGVLWEFFEFAMDRLILVDMQKDTVLHTISTVMLDPNKGTKAVSVSGIRDTVLILEDGTQVALGLGGYLDIGIVDTMKDLFVNFIGAVIFSIFGFFYAKSKGKKHSALRNFIPRRKT